MCYSRENSISRDNDSFLDKKKTMVVFGLKYVLIHKPNLKMNANIHVSYSAVRIYRCQLFPYEKFYFNKQLCLKASQYRDCYS